MSGWEIIGRLYVTLCTSAAILLLGYVALAHYRAWRLRRAWQHLDSLAAEILIASIPKRVTHE